mmetsp:Transcript_104698/g.208013  ORF Transcript_104698/g.208013 Transcript_104698/m.208013 type:complete len:209 (-) Transcript_104698:65-691(-)|eukprot:CAMPEP_0172658288 /NCGR_PEP_ID=MMETSP1074-20121228/2700_1 /TAXON_ID=2916 /ORGANISM="Ceratium fusus, Strain PA161109" /LENGTH=208 /DNA_ID=CAMNT_0013473565 /DNA_START=48 /DNA_END=674 /DNA_ORIENTATION=-
MAIWRFALVVAGCAAVPDVVELKHAKDDLALLIEQDQQQFRADTEEIDRLTDRKRHYEGKEAPLEAAALEDVAATLVQKAESAALRGAGQVLGASADEVKRIDEDIKRVTAAGKMLHTSIAQHESMLTVIEHQIRLLQWRENRKAETAETGGHLGIVGSDEGLDENAEDESASALESAIGWKQEDLERQAFSTQEALTSGIGRKSAFR